MRMKFTSLPILPILLLFIHIPPLCLPCSLKIALRWAFNTNVRFLGIFSTGPSSQRGIYMRARWWWHLLCLLATFIAAFHGVADGEDQTNPSLGSVFSSVFLPLPFPFPPLPLPSPSNWPWSSRAAAPLAYHHPGYSSQLSAILYRRKLV